MRGQLHAPTRQLLGLAAVAALCTPGSPAAASASAVSPATLPHCAESVVPLPDDGRIVRPWSAVLDEDGEVTGYSLTLRTGGEDIELGTGARGFSGQAGPERTLIGERSGSDTRLDMLDTTRGCLVWSRAFGRSIYLERVGTRDGRLRFGVVDPGTRAYRGRMLIDADDGSGGSVEAVPCVSACLPTDGNVSLAALEPASAPRPVPSFGGGGWDRDKRLTYRWRSGGVPPSWARGPMKAAAEDATGTTRARGPRFVYDSGAANGVGYTSSVPSYCGINGIACAGRAMPTTWGVWIRPHGTEYTWGVLRWCQKTSSGSGCFDIRRVLLHELGHIDGLDHPSNAGFTLAADETVMHAVTPMRPSAGASRHSFGRCDVATLQELYDTPTSKTRISTCNDVSTRVTLTASTTSVIPGSSVKLKAQLRVATRSAYGYLAGNILDDRSVKLKYRRAGSDDSWKVAWMEPTSSGGRYVVTIAPGATWEFKAVFPAPTNEGLRYSASDAVKVRVKR